PEPDRPDFDALYQTGEHPHPRCTKPDAHRLRISMTPHAHRRAHRTTPLRGHNSHSYQFSHASRDTADRACAHQNHDIAITHKAKDGIGQICYVFYKNRFHLAHNTDGTRQCTTISSHQRRLACGVDFCQEYPISLAENLHKIFEAITCTCIAVRLKRQHNATVRPGTTRSFQRGCHFDRMVTVVVNDSEFATT